MKRYKKFTHVMVKGGFIADEGANPFSNPEIELNDKLELWLSNKSINIVSITPTQVSFDGCLVTTLHLIYE